MEKFDTYSTLTSFVSAHASAETAENTPFMFIIKSHEKVACITSSTTHNLVQIFQVVLNNFVDSMRQSAKDPARKDEVVKEMLDDMCKGALARSRLLEDLPEGLREDLKELL